MGEKEIIRIDFVDFWRALDKRDNYFYNLLEDKFRVEILSDAEYLFFSVFGDRHRNRVGKKIFYTGENIPPCMDYCDWAFSFDFLDHPRHYRLPHYLLYDGYYELTNSKKVDESLAEREFCNVVVSNGNCKRRNKFIEELFRYKEFDSGGAWNNNIGYVVTDKRKFQSRYKFSIAFENDSYRPEHPGYTTEKIMDPMTVNSVPIYWGNPAIWVDFNPKSFVNCYDFKSDKEVIDYIIYLDQNDDKYLELLGQPWLVDNKIPENNKIENIKSFLYGIFVQ